MSARIVTETRHILWDGVTQRLRKGQVIDVPPGGALEREIGAEYLVPMPGTVQPAAEEAAVAEETAPPAEETAVRGGGGGEYAGTAASSGPQVTRIVPSRSRTVGKKQDDGKKQDGKP
jgi:hypothetical protein